MRTVLLTEYQYAVQARDTDLDGDFSWKNLDGVYMSFAEANETRRRLIRSAIADSVRNKSGMKHEYRVIRWKVSPIEIVEE